MTYHDGLGNGRRQDDIAKKRMQLKHESEVEDLNSSKKQAERKVAIFNLLGISKIIFRKLFSSVSLNTLLFMFAFDYFR